MCGIAGIAGNSSKVVLQEELQVMCDAMVHRGPDDEGFYIDEGVGLAMRRLSIIDIEKGQQPVRNEDKSVWAVLNGEIYNYRELRTDLKKRGHTFYTDGDTETIVHLYEEYGDKCVEKLRGMFSFALWDVRAKTLLLARDRIGIKPLYYCELNGRLVFASELKVLLQLPEIQRDFNWSAVNHVFTFLSTPAAESIIAGIHKLEPGHTLTLTPDAGVRLRRYWNVSLESEYGRSEKAIIERLRELLDESVRLHLVSDVPLGAFLSGGMDSSAVVATMAPMMGSALKTFSIGFQEQDHDETKYARHVASHFGTDHHELYLDPDITGVVGDLVWNLDEPFGDASAIPTYIVSKLAAEHVSVVLSGDGGDELFGGYDKYVVESRERNYQRMAAPVRYLLRYVSAAMPEGARGRKFLHHFSLSGNARYLDALTLFNIDDQQQLFMPAVAEQIRHGDAWRNARDVLSVVKSNWLSSIQYYDLHSYLPLDILTKVDRMSMAHSIEARVPLLDHKLVEFAAGIPPELKLRNGTTKYIFKQAMRGILPDSIIDRPKKGFAVPLGSWFRGQLSGFVREHLLSARCRNRGIFNPAYIEKLISLHEAGRPMDTQLWTLLSFELWCRNFLDSDSQTKQRHPGESIASSAQIQKQFADVRVGA